MEGLGISPDGCAAVLPRVITKALPPDLGILYCQRLKEASSNHADTVVGTRDNSKEVKHLVTFLGFQGKATKESCLDQASSSASQRHHQRESRPLVLHSPSATLLSTEEKSPYTRPCLLCNQSDHIVRECSPSLTSEEKRIRLQACGHCFRCTKRNHVASEYQSIRTLQWTHWVG
ncbi:hypothetical protein HPB49_005131 [Dermacentor silvarum]|uniref:Uncharacterized protein n=1 Tax=Dermacentor silvarum TaxID=543639 RepID=A0ACB8CDC8_DERSI|nr:hypothetical protein HPB49_005131 [Dermacentor silvarum]